MTSRVRLTKQHHLFICNMHEKRPERSYNELAEWACTQFELPKRPGKSTIMGIVRTKRALNQLSADCLAKQRLRSPHTMRLDAAVVEFVVEAELSHTLISGKEIMQVSEGLANDLSLPASVHPRFTRSGWLRHFLARYGFRHKRAHGEVASVDHVEALKHAERIREKIRHFHPAGVYNMDETALYYKAVPRTSVCLLRAPALKRNKARVTMVVATNAGGGDKLPLVILGKAENPRWLAEKPEGVEYVDTAKGWMNAATYQTWLRALDDRMMTEDRKVLLLVDNAFSHILGDTTLTNVTVNKLPPNTTSLLQPMDQGVIAALKRGFMNRKTEAAVDRFLDGDKQPYDVSLVEGIEWCCESWASISADAVKNCWKHATLLVDRTRIENLLE